MTVNVPAKVFALQQEARQRPRKGAMRMQISVPGAEIDGVSSWQGVMAPGVGNWMMVCAREGFLGSELEDVGTLKLLALVLESELFAGGNAGFYAGEKGFHLAI